MSGRVLICDADRYTTDVFELLSSEFTVFKSAANDRKALSDEIVNNRIEVLFCNLATKIDALLLNDASELKFVVSPTTGLSHVDLEYLKERSITCVYLGQIKSEISSVFATAELAWALLLAVARKMSLASISTQSGDWRRENFFGVSLSNKVIGIIGFGRLGRRVAEYALSFGMTVLAYDSDQKVFADLDKSIVQCKLEYLILNSDFVSIHIPLNDDTENLISRERIDLLRDGAVLINTSRGEVVDEGALVDAVKSGKLFGVGADVLRNENDNNFDASKSDLVQAANNGYNVVVTPHIGGWTDDAVRVTRRVIAEEFMKIYNENKSATT